MDKADRQIPQHISELNDKHLDKAIQLIQHESFEAAQIIIDGILKNKPKDLGALQLAAIIATEKNQFDLAEAILQQVLDLEPKNPQILGLFGLLYQRQNNFEEALGYYLEAFNQQSNELTAINLGIAYQAQQQFDKALEWYQTALKYDPFHEMTFYHLASCYIDMGLYQTAIETYRKGLTINEEHVSLLIGLAKALMITSRKFSEAIMLLQKALDCENQNIDILLQLGHAYRFTSSYAKALVYYQTILSIEAHHLESYHYIGLIYKHQKQYDKALNFFKLCYDLDSQYEDNTQEYLYTKQLLCDWEGTEELKYEIHAATFAAVNDKQVPAEDPVHLLHRCQDQTLALQVASIRATAIETVQAESREQFNFRLPADQARIKVGYLVGCVHDQALCEFLSEILARHDYQNFMVHVYADDSSEIRHFHNLQLQQKGYYRDIQDETIQELTKIIQGDGIQVLIDLQGFKEEKNLHVMANRAAPVQLSYFGFPSTLGANFVDGMIADKVICPEADSIYYKEQILRLPQSFSTVYHRHHMTQDEYTRVDFGANDDLFLIGCMHKPEQIEPELLDAWLEILAQCPNVGLVFIEHNIWMKENLLQQIKARGMQTEKVFFLPKTTRDKYLKQVELLDLVLDSVNVSHYDLTADALWLFVPVITLYGQNAASRLSASLLQACEVPECITHSYKEYVDLAVKLNLDKKLYKSVQDKLKSESAQKVFDSSGIKDLESIYQQCWQDYLAAVGGVEQTQKGKL